MQHHRVHFDGEINENAETPPPSNHAPGAGPTKRTAGRLTLFKTVLSHKLQANLVRPHFPPKKYIFDPMATGQVGSGSLSPFPRLPLPPHPLIHTASKPPPSPGAGTDRTPKPFSRPKQHVRTPQTRPMPRGQGIA